MAATTPIPKISHSTKYVKGKPLAAQGSLSTVYECTLRDDIEFVNANDETDKSRDFVLKVIAIDDKKLQGKQLDYLRREKAVLRQSNGSDYIVKLYDVFQDDDHTLSMVMERMDGDLYDFVNANRMYARECAPFIGNKILRGIADIHDFGAVHRDIKPDNILYRWNADKTDLEIKIADFGFAKFANDAHTPVDEAAKGRAKVWMDRQTGGIFDTADILKQDVWSAGLVMFFLLRWCLPLPKFIDECFEEKLELPIHTWLPQEHADVLSRLLKILPRERQSATEALTDPYFTRTLQLPQQQQPAPTPLEASAPALHEDRLATDVSQATFSAVNKKGSFELEEPVCYRTVSPDPAIDGEMHEEP